MHTVDLMDQAVTAAESLGYGIRQEFLGGVGGGACEIAGTRWIFIDLGLRSVDQLEQVLDVLSADPGVYTLSLSRELALVLGIQDRRSAA